MDADLSDLQRKLNACGLSGGLEFLNRRVQHRFTAVYKLERDAFRVMAMVDKLHEAVPEILGLLPFDDSLCQYSVGLGRFVSADTVGDRRLDGHIHQATVGSYAGLPLDRPEGGLYGSFCHFDLVPQALGEDEFLFLQRAVKTLGQYLPVEETLQAPAG